MKEKWIKLRMMRGESILSIARKTGISSGAITNFEKGKSNMSIENYEKLIRSLGAEIKIIIDINDELTGYFKNRTET